jgi:ribonucleoside-diphosphate reductase alpha chain
MYDRPQLLKGTIRKVKTGEGNVYVTVAHDEFGHPREVFATRGKGGTCDSAYIDAITRLVSLALQSNVNPSSIVAQLAGITCHPGFDTRIVGSVSDAIALTLEEDIGRSSWGPTTQAASVSTAVNGNLCPDCQQNSMVPDGGCSYCRECGYSAC